ncbi:hypothetical protein [Thalassococcus sp. S3]|uniref:hypothetical protein n=1 Tax=Thalassococcus sp. S3 TaxID=2017482 RepID=UPI001024562F|nr:hypothetical protein [Thalassococcus sp. S3]QBF31577.1 hypothetical protein CFI11_10155 [Thalassococcus sp. S3]
MNLNRIINMIMRILMRKAINKGVNVGINQASRAIKRPGKSAPPLPPERVDVAEASDPEEAQTGPTKQEVRARRKARREIRAARQARRNAGS